MTIDGDPGAPPDGTRPHGRRAVGSSAPAVAAARARSRRAWRRWTLVVVVLGLVLAAGVAQVWRHAEIRAVSVRPAPTSAHPVPAGSPAARLSTAWTMPEATAVGTPSNLDIVVTWAGHTVHGRDVRTGAERWSYTRSDRTLCTAVVQDGTVRAIYAHDGNCDEVTGLSESTGARIWNRTLFTDGTDIHVSTHSGYVLITAPGSLDLFQATGDYEWWFDAQPAGCTTLDAVLGFSGVLIASRCADGDTLSLHSLVHKDVAAREWTVKLAGRGLLSADGGLSVLSADGRSVQSLNVSNGAPLLTVPLVGAEQPATRAASLTSIVAGTTVALTRSGLLSLNGGASAVLWQKAGLGLPVTAGGDVLLAPAAGRLVAIDVLSGAEVSSRSVPAATVSSSVDIFGSWVLVGSPSTTTVLH